MSTTPVAGSGAGKGYASATLAIPNDASLFGNPSWVTGKVGSYALALNGTSQYGAVPDNASLDLTTNLGGIWFAGAQHKLNTQGKLRRSLQQVNNAFLTSDAPNEENIRARWFYAMGFVRL